MSDPTPPAGDPPSDTSRLSRTRLLSAAAIVGLVAVVLGLLWKLNNAGPAARTENVELKQQLANMQEMLTDLKRAEQLRTEEEQIRRSDFQATAASAEEAAGAVAAFEKAAADWERATRELLTGEKGKAVAANALALAQFHALWQQPRPGADEPATLRRRLDPLKAVIDKAVAANDPSYAPSEEVVARLKAVREEAGRGSGAYGELNRRLDAVVASAPPVAPRAETPSLEAALEERERRILAEQNAVITAAIEQERREGTERLAREKAASERQIADAQVEAERVRKGAELKRLADESVAAKAKAAGEERARAQALQEAELERKFDAALPEIRNLLRPFITDGFQQLKDGNYTKTLTKGPVSFSALQGSGHLDKTTDGVYKLRSAMYLGETNDRELGSFPGYYTREWHQGAARAQELLIEFGPLLVKKKMLAP